MPFLLIYSLQIFAFHIYSDFEFDQSCFVNIGAFDQFFVALVFDTQDAQYLQDMPVPSSQLLI